MGAYSRINGMYNLLIYQIHIDFQAKGGLVILKKGLLKRTHKFITFGENQ